VNAELPPARDSQSKPPAWYERQKSRERIKLIGFLRFGKTIPWGAR